MKKPLLLSAALLFSVLLFAPQARAEDVVITGGFLFAPEIYTNPQSYSFTGQGFSVTGSGDGGNVRVRACSDLECPAGTVLNLGVDFAGGTELGGGPTTVGGVSYPHLWYSGQLLFEGSFVLPPDSPSTVVFTAPFTMTGTMRGYLKNPFFGDPGPEIFSATLSGQGIASIQLISAILTRNGQTQRYYQFKSITYNFQPAPVPEPATLVLLGSGLAGLAARARRRRRAARSDETRADA